MSDFQHLGIAVKRNDEDTSAAPPTKISPSVLAARKAFEKVDQASPQQQPSIEEVRGAYTTEPASTNASSSATDAAPQPKSSTDINTTYNPPVVHETVKIQRHDIRQEVVHRDIHVHHEVTKIQPIIEQVLLPARHFVETADGSKVEIPAPESTQHATDHGRRREHDAVSSIVPRTQHGEAGAVHDHMLNKATQS